ncbi:MAG: 4Fe-4S binding protein [Bacteroidales bacterium]|nr:4Fe-4S binding protein [Bacteroidales bacterium]
MKHLRAIRIVAATVFLLGITALFLIPGDATAHWLGWMAKLQLLPAVLAANVVVVVFILLVTYLLGRVYCSVVCPLGILQDLFYKLGHIGKRRKEGRMKYGKPHNWLRYTVLALFVASLAAGFNSVALLIAPYSAYGRIVATAADLHTAGTATAIVAGATLLAVAILSLLCGRLWCNSVCPVGSALSLLSRHSLVQPRFDAEKCIGCGKCERMCKAMCIDVASKSVDTSRCVACMDCVSLCPTGALTLRTKGGKAATATERPDSGDGTSRRQFLAATAAVAVAATIKAQEHKIDGGLAAIQKKAVPKRTTPLKPYGAVSLRHFEKHCTACQLCVSHCPNGVLRPSAELQSLMQPEMSYEKGYCRPECVACSEVCPTGAIKRITPEEKSTISIGHAVVLRDNCLAALGEAACGNCARHCPAEAITMQQQGPVVDESRCIGCGACEYLCPVRPFSAIYVEGRELHVRNL